MKQGSPHERVLHGIDEIVDLSHTAFVIVDVQNDFVSDVGFLAKFGLNVTDIQAALPHINKFIRMCRAHDVPVIYIKEIISASTVLPNFLTQYGEFNRVPVREGTWGAEFHGDLISPEPGEPVITKPCYDGFEDTKLDVTLRSLGIRTCIYAGFASNVCVEATARHGFVKGYYSVLLSDASATGTWEEHAACTRLFQMFYGPVLRTDEVRTVWERARKAAALAGPS